MWNSPTFLKSGMQVFRHLKCSSLSTMVQQSLHNGPATNSNVVATEVGVQSFSVGRIANVGIAMISSGELATVSVILPQLDLPVMIFTHILTRFATVVPHSFTWTH